MAQRFPGPGPAPVPPGPPQQRYPPPQNPQLRQYSGPSFPVNNLSRIMYFLVLYGLCSV